MLIGLESLRDIAWADVCLIFIVGALEEQSQSNTSTSSSRNSMMNNNLQYLFGMVAEQQWDSISGILDSLGKCFRRASGKGQGLRNNFGSV